MINWTHAKTFSKQDAAVLVENINKLLQFNASGDVELIALQANVVRSIIAKLRGIDLKSVSSFAFENEGGKYVLGKFEGDTFMVGYITLAHYQAICGVENKN